MSFDEKQPISTGITREEGFNLIEEHTKSENLIKHMLASEAAMREYAEKYAKESKLHKDNIDTWALAGLLHDVMYEKDLKGHMYSGADLAKESGVSEYITHAISVHGNFDGTDQNTLLDKVLWVAEECTGLVVAATLVLPSRKLNDLKLKSLIKKFNDKSFAAKIDRDNIKFGVGQLGLTVEEHLEIILNGMKKISKELEL